MEEEGEVMTKTCPRCKAEKPETDFYRHPKGRLYPYCHPCAKEYSRERARIKKEKAVANG